MQAVYTWRLSHRMALHRYGSKEVLDGTKRRFMMQVIGERVTSFVKRYRKVAVLALCLSTMYVLNVERFRGNKMVLEAMGFLYRVISYPGYMVQTQYDGFIASAFERKYGYKAELYEQLRDEVSQVELLQAENRSLRTSSKYVDNGLFIHVSARAVSVSGVAFSQTFLINAGSGDGIAIGAIVVNENQLIGRVINVATKSSRVSMVTDPNFKISGVFVRSGQSCIISGGGDGLLNARYVPEPSLIEAQDLLVTSGEGELVPYGIKIGRAFFENGSLKIKSTTNFSNPGIVTVLIAK